MVVKEGEGLGWSVLDEGGISKYVWGIINEGRKLVIEFLVVIGDGCYVS